MVAIRKEGGEMTRGAAANGWLWLALIFACSAMVVFAVGIGRAETMMAAAGAPQARATVRTAN